MDADNLDKLDAVIGAATPGPWKARVSESSDETGEHYTCAEVLTQPLRRGPSFFIGDTDPAQDEANARAIVASHDVMPELLAVARAVTDSDTIAALMLSDHPHASDCARTLVAALDALRAKTAEVLP